MTAADERYERAWNRSAASSLPVAGSRLSRLVRSADAEDRLAALLIVRRQIDRNGVRDQYLPLARSLVADPDDPCRWQALMVVGQFAERRASAVWPVVLEHGASASADTRSAVATTLLEPILEHHYEKYFPVLKAAVEGGDARLTDTLRRCWMFGGAKRHSREVDRLLGSVGRE
jgi:hypothetical protein